jgi:tripartite-type tricarboxylate transporter receptor subunit TctC
VVDGSSEKVTALLGGQVDFTDGGLGGLLPSVQSGQQRALTVWSPERSDTLIVVPFSDGDGGMSGVSRRDPDESPESTPQHTSSRHLSGP